MRIEASFFVGPNRAFRQIELGFPLVEHSLQISEIIGRFQLVSHDIDKPGLAGIELDAYTARESTGETTKIVTEAVHWWGGGYAGRDVYVGLVFPGLNSATYQDVAPGIEYIWRMFVEGGKVHLQVLDWSANVLFDNYSKWQPNDALYLYERGTAEYPKPLFVPLEYWHYDGSYGKFNIEFNLDIDSISGNLGGRIGTWPATQALMLAGNGIIDDSNYARPLGMSMAACPVGDSYHIEAEIHDNS